MDRTRFLSAMTRFGTVSGAIFVLALVGPFSGPTEAQAIGATEPSTNTMTPLDGRQQVTVQDQATNDGEGVFESRSNEDFVSKLIGAPIYAPAEHSQLQEPMQQHSAAQQTIGTEQRGLSEIPVRQEDLEQMEYLGSVANVILDDQGEVWVVVFEFDGLIGIRGYQMEVGVEYIDFGRAEHDNDNIVIISQIGGTEFDEMISEGGWFSDTFGRPAATHLFGGPEDFPPEDFAAYAILASWSQPRQERERFIAICMAYATILSPTDSPIVPPPERQLVTVWPIEAVELAQELRGGPDEDRCAIAVDHYDLETARQAIRDAETSSPRLRAELASREGPFLIAWNPAGDKGKPNMPIFRMDLSEARTQAQAMSYFRLWRQGILDNAENWLDGWHDPGVRLRVRVFLENYGEHAVEAISSAARAMGIIDPTSR